MAVNDSPLFFIHVVNKSGYHFTPTLLLNIERYTLYIYMWFIIFFLAE